jgi:hypothetical protein
MMTKPGASFTDRHVRQPPQSHVLQWHQTNFGI